ncbi:endonuclease/exonuclease/phosphatase family protein [Vibrio mytili]|uniref:Hydrolase n=1 Tax=Vibrio mytili TaxID=50718 RepID=A0A0C3HUV4_9VIBR|nr:endonuclease/exonuclease/phosphatase family protein [Vibrio mytili]KIN11996.1 hydrolase [Vibrio mytili]
MRSFFAIPLLLFCSASFAQDSVKLTSWNIEWLSSDGGKISRNRDDFKKLHDYVDNFQADVLAFQEVDSKDAIQKVVGNDYVIYMSDRSASHNKSLQFSDTNQYTGFAVRKGIKVSDPTDFRITPNSSKLRFASYIVMNPNTKNETHLLSVHLKAGCSGAYKNSRECKTLTKQGQALAKWMNAREANQQHYVVLGDFNHNLAYQGDWLWEVMTNGNRARLATHKTQAECKVRSNRNANKTHQFRSLIDHIVVSSNLDAALVKQTVFTSRDVLNYKLSDHCPINAEISIH